MISTSTTILSTTSTRGDTFFYLSKFRVTTYINIDKTINISDYVYPLRIFHSAINNHHANITTTTLPMIYTTTTILSTTSTRGDTFFHLSKFGVTNLTLLTIEINIITPTLTTTSIDIRGDIIHSSTQLALLINGFMSCKPPPWSLLYRRSTISTATITILLTTTFAAIVTACLLIDVPPLLQQILHSAIMDNVDIGSVDLSQVITLQLVFSPAPWVRSVGYTLLMITIR
jgi:hypothetical protein